MAGGSTAAQLVVVHAGQIVMDEREGVEQLDRASQERPGHAATSGSLESEQDETGTDPLPSRKNRMPHRSMDRLRTLGRGRKDPPQRRLDSLRSPAVPAPPRGARLVRHPLPPP